MRSRLLLLNRSVVWSESWPEYCLNYLFYFVCKKSWHFQIEASLNAPITLLFLKFFCFHWFIHYVRWGIPCHACLHKAVKAYCPKGVGLTYSLGGRVAFLFNTFAMLFLILEVQGSSKKWASVFSNKQRKGQFLCSFFRHSYFPVDFSHPVLPYLTGHHPRVTW